MKDHFVLRNMSTNENIPIVSDSVMLGRHESCEIVVDSGEASRKHARITLEDGRLTLEDLGSTNGTVLNGRRLRQPEVLGGGDIIVIGQVHYLVVAPGSAGHMTILGGRLGRVEENYVVDQADPDVTGLRVPFPKPPGWQDSDDFAESRTTGNKSLNQLERELTRQGIGSENNAAVLMIVSNKGRNTLFPLPAGKKSWTLGRAATNDVEIYDVTISAVHASITRQSGSWQVEDNKSTNGTRVNGRKIDKSALDDGDKLTLGKVDLLFKSL